MAQYNGVMAGIGDLENNINVINPEFDARVNNFIIGANGVIKGLEISGNILSAGMCVAQGYRGSIDTDITLDITTYVYGVFKVYHDPEILDEFYIQTSSTPLDTAKTGNSFGDDILHSAGTYYLRLNNRLKYPINAVNSENTNILNDNGTIGNNVTCPTQAVNDNSTKVASTAYVYNQIKEEINYTEYISYVYAKSNTSAEDIPQYVELKFTKKAGYVIVEATGKNENFNVSGYTFQIDNIPTEFLPINGIATLLVPTVNTTGGGLTHYVTVSVFKINNSGEIQDTNSGYVLNQNQTDINTAKDLFFNTTYYSGWRTNI